MTFKLPGKPSARADVHEIADYLELLAWTSRRRRISFRELHAILGREGENEYNEGCLDEDVALDEDLGQVADEIERRQSACRDRYPYRLDTVGNVLEYVPRDETSTMLYGYLLLSTRLNMKNDSLQAGINGTQLLEFVTAEALRQYLGEGRARSIVFGTASDTPGFSERVSDLCRLVREGVEFRNNYELPLTAKDDKLDAVAWLPFADGKGSQVVIYGQCKTGTAWTDQLCQLVPQGFNQKWIHTQFLTEPIRAFFVSEAVNRISWAGYAIAGGLFFDRCRLVDCCETINRPIYRQMRTWNRAALSVARAGL